MMFTWVFRVFRASPAQLVAFYDIQTYLCRFYLVPNAKKDAARQRLEHSVVNATVF
jgi:hypothetical protein